MVNLLKDYTQDDLEILCSRYGEIISLRVVVDCHGVSRGSEFVILDKPSKAEKAIS